MADVVATPVLVIEDTEIVRLAGELAALRNTSVPHAVALALREGVKREREMQDRTEALLAVGREIRAHLIEPLSVDDVEALLYGPDGLPA